MRSGRSQYASGRAIGFGSGAKSEVEEGKRTDEGGVSAETRWAGEGLVSEGTVSNGVEVS